MSHEPLLNVPPSEPKPSDQVTITASNISDPNLSASMQALILEELRQLNRLQAEIAIDRPLKSQALLSFLLQLIAFMAALLFGVFAILAWKLAGQANTLSEVSVDLTTKANELASRANSYAYYASEAAFNANQMSLVAYCQSQTNLTSAARQLCSRIQGSAVASLAVYASSYYPSIQASATFGSPTSGATSTSSPGDSYASPPPKTPSVIVGIVFGGLGALGLTAAIAFYQYRIYQQKMRRNAAIKSMARHVGVS